MIQEEIVALKRKKTILEKTVVDLSKDAGQFALDAKNADEKEDIKLLLSKSNSFRRTANQKKEIEECAEQFKQPNEKKDSIV